MCSNQDFDVAIIGGGVVGCSMLYHLTNLGYKCILLEKSPDLVSGASCGNSGMLHTGFDAPMGSLELSCIRKCQEDIHDVIASLGVPVYGGGASMVAWDTTEGDRLHKIKAEADMKGIDVMQVSLSDLYKKEPELRRTAQSALWIPGECVIDPWLLPTAMAHSASRRGSQIWRQCEFEGCVREGQQWKVNTSHRVFTCSSIINCAGLYGDKVDAMVGKQVFDILPRKGQYTVYVKQVGSLISSSILPVPSQSTKGIIIFKSVYGNLIIGPTAENVPDRSIPCLDEAVTQRLVQYGHRVLPSLAHREHIGGYTGLRPATQYTDYQIHTDSTRQWVTVGGIRSTGLSGCLGIAHHVGQTLSNDIYLEPSGQPWSNTDRIHLQLDPLTGKATADECVYNVTHPITLFGMELKPKL